MVELQVGEASPLLGKTLEACGLRQRDAVVLSLSREGKIIPNPRSDRVLALGDRLLCFGKYLNLRDLIPPQKTKKRRKRPAQPPPTI